LKTKRETGNMVKMMFCGVDLAWSPKNATGITILEGDKNKAKHISSKIVFSDQEIIEHIKEKVADSHAIIAIDAPLIVPNEEGRRVAEEIVGSLFRRYNAGAHPSNRKRLSSWSGKIRGEEISKLLEKEGFIHDPYIKKHEESKKFLEVYPHPSIVVLFNLNKILQYKSKPKRDYSFRWNEFKKYQNHLHNLKKQNPSLTLPSEITKKKVEELKGKALKDFEDILDSILCAYLAYFSWHSPEKCEVLGDMEKGYILTPIFDHMREILSSGKSQTKLKDF
jgi:predicted RNase H-like nuclease